MKMPSIKLAIINISIFATLFGIQNQATALNFTIPSTVTVLGNSESGTSFTVSQNYTASDTISIEAIGVVDIFDAVLYNINAAGILTNPSLSIETGGTGTDPQGLNPTSIPGALLIGNSTLGYHSLFAATVQNGLGSSQPPTDLKETVTLESLFGSGFIGLTNGTVLNFIVDDTPGDYGDNSGSFTVKPYQEQVPFNVWGGAPITIFSTLLGISLLRIFRKKE